MQITTATLNAITPFAADRDVRTYLMGVHVTKEGTQCRLTASDGSAIATASWEDHADPDDYSVIIPPDLLPIKTNSLWLDLAKVDANLYTLSDGIGLSVNFRGIEGRYPDCERCWPRYLSEDHTPINPEFMARVLKTCKAQKIKPDRVRTWPAGQGVLFRAGDVRGYITGLRFKEKEEVMPAWREAAL
jgi:DNA polymerase III beta subunit, central domain